jgi:hypothetical protein
MQPAGWPPLLRVTFHRVAALAVIDRGRGRFHSTTASDAGRVSRLGGGEATARPPWFNL